MSTPSSFELMTGSLLKLSGFRNMGFVCKAFPFCMYKLQCRIRSCCVRTLHVLLNVNVGTLQALRWNYVGLESKC